MKRGLVLVFTLMFLGMSAGLVSVSLSGCSDSETSAPSKCKSDSDCKDGFFCSEAGVCMPKMDGDSEEGSDSELSDWIDWEYDTELWEKDCSEVDRPQPPNAQPPCKVWACAPFDPPECWRCAFVADPSQNGEICTDENGNSGICADGVCNTISDGDGENDTVETDSDADDSVVDGDTEENEVVTPACITMGGSCEDRCPNGTFLLQDKFGCSNSCCMPKSNVSCFDDAAGYCVASGTRCATGFELSDEPKGCDQYGFGGCCVPAGTNCVAEGEEGSLFDDDVCCDGLTQISNAEPGPDNTCVAPPNGGFMCTLCGNGECGPGENWCNCEDDCAKPGECSDDSQCPAPSCRDRAIGCEQHTFVCDASQGKCVETVQTMDGMRCNQTTGECERQITMCESEDNGVCSDSPDCPPGYLANEQALGCDRQGGEHATCCMRNDCLTQGGYCTMWQQGCQDGYEMADNSIELGCPGGRSALCCLPKQQECIGVGEIGYIMNDDVCCEGLTQASYAVINDEGQCEYLECSCFVCLDIGDGVCDAAHRENWCNSEDCEPPNPSCTKDADCLGREWLIDCEGSWDCNERGECVPACGGSCGNGACEPELGEDVNNCYVDCGAPACNSDEDCHYCEQQGADCIEYFGVCANGLCQDGSAGYVMNARCDFNTGTCITNPTNECIQNNGQCVPYYGCPEGMEPADLDCSDPGTHCCIPSHRTDCERVYGGYCSTTFQGCALGEHGIGPNGCEQVVGMNAICCVPGVPECTTDDDCVKCEDRNTPQGNTCIQYRGSCDNGTCRGDSAVAMPGQHCNYDTGHCEQDVQWECTQSGGFCTDRYSCPPGSHVESKECPADRPMCCVPDNVQTECERRGGMCGGEVGCPPGYQMSEDPLGCPDSPIGPGFCCLPDNPTCITNQDCGEPSCFQRQDSCVQITPICENGQCTNNRERLPGYFCDGRTCRSDDEGCRSDEECGAARCYDTSANSCVEVIPRCDINTGVCMEEENEYIDQVCNPQTGRCDSNVTYNCSDVNGYCTNGSCPDTYHEDPNGSCWGSLTCCVPDDVSQTCESLNGVCVGYWSSCPSDKPNSAGQHDCRPWERCCIP